MGDIEVWCHTVANLATLTYDDKRIALDALGVQVRLWPKGHEPRFDMTAAIDVPIVFTSS